MKKRNKNATHRLYIFHKDTLIGKYNVATDNWEDLYKELSLRVIKSGMAMGFPLHHQIKVSEQYLNDIEKQTRHCEKIKLLDFWKVLASFFFLYKVNKVDGNNFIFLKNKSKKKRHCI